MVDAKLTALPSVTALASNDIIYVVDDPNIAPISSQATMTVLGNYMTANLSSFHNPLRIGNELTSTAFGVVSVHHTRITLNAHAFEDYSVLSETINPALGYSSFDSNPNLGGVGTVDHYAAFQARPTLSGSGNVTTSIRTFTSAPVFSGTGTVARVESLVSNPVCSGGGTITTHYGAHIFDVKGVGGGAIVGTVQNSNGIMIEDITSGTVSNWSLYCGRGNVHFTDNVGVGVVATEGKFHVQSTAAGKVLVSKLTGAGANELDIWLNGGKSYLMHDGDFAFSPTAVQLAQVTINTSGNLLVGTVVDGMTAAGSLAIEKDISHRGILAGFFNHATHAQPQKAMHANWATPADVAAALAELGLVDSA